MQLKRKVERQSLFSYERMLDKHEVLVRITHCSITMTGATQNFPLVPGHEIIGIIEGAGSEVIGLKHGDRVGGGYQQKACFECEFCKEGNEQFCAKQKVIAVDCYGGLAEHIAVDGRFVFKLPSELDSAKLL